jgi:hypothetical protein
LSIAVFPLSFATDSPLEWVKNDFWHARAARPYQSWGENLDAAAVEQMRNTMRLEVAVGAALMPDAHVGYGLPTR